MKRRGTDSWTTALACAFVAMMMHGTTRLSGILFVASMDRFNVNREKASFPFVLCDFMLCVSGPFVVFLGHKFGLRPVLTLGCFIAPIGIGFCFLAEDIVIVTIFWGVVYGFGFGLSTLLLPQVLTLYFMDDRATVTAVLFTGTYLGFFLLPGIVEILIKKYGLSGTFLLLSGFLFHCVPAALLIRKPTFEAGNLISNMTTFKTPRRGIAKRISGKKQLYDVESDLFDNQDVTIKQSKIKELYKKEPGLRDSQNADGVGKINLLGIKKLSGDFQDSRNVYEITNMATNEKDDIGEFPILELKSDSVIPNGIKSLNSSDEGILPSRCTANNYHFNGFSIIPQTGESSKGPRELRPPPECHSRATLTSSEARSNNRKKLTNVKHVHGLLSRSFKFKVELPVVCRVISEPIFILVSIAMMVFGLSYVTFLTIIVDFCRDIKIDVSFEKYVIMCFAAASNISLVSLDWITDLGFISRMSFAGLCFLGRCVPMFFIPFSADLPMLITQVSFMGFCESSLWNMFPLILVDCLPEDKQTFSLSSFSFLSGPFFLLVPHLVGYFRDYLGSYYYIFYLMSFLSLICGISMFYVPYLAKISATRQSKMNFKSTEPEDREEFLTKL